MTTAQLLAARMLIPAEFELHAAPHRQGRLAPPVITVQEDSHAPIVGAVAHVVAAPARPTTRLGFAAGILGDLAIVMALIYGVALLPSLAVQGIKAAAALVAGTFGGH